MRLLVIGSSTGGGFDPFSNGIDAYGNPVDYEPLLGFAVGGLLSLHSWLSRGLGRAPSLDLSLWTSGCERVGLARAEMAQSFLRLSDGLQALLKANECCIQHARDAVAAGNLPTAEGTETTLIASARLLQRVLRFGEQGRAGAVTIREDLDELDRLARRILLMEAAIEEHMRPAEVVQVLLRIECARLDDAARAPLEALSAEIARTCQKMAQTMQMEFQLVEETNETVNRMIEHVRVFEKRQREAEQRRCDLASEMEFLSQRAQEHIERDHMLSKIAEELGRTVFAVIEAMQYQDIVGQRWEHVQEGFATIQCAERGEAESGWNAIVQQAQLAEANSEMAAALSRIEARLAALAEAEGQVGRELDVSLQDSRRQEVHIRMHAVLFEAADMVHINETQMRSTDEMIAPLVQVAGKMGTQIGDVSHEMRMIALNAQIQAARFGASTGLEVLAESLRRIADEMGESGAALDADSRQIEQIAADLRACFAELHGQAMAVCQECDRDFPTMTEQLLNQEANCTRSLRLAVESLKALSAAREQMERGLESALAPLEDLTQLAQQCGEFVEEHYRKDARVEAFMKDQLLEAESSRYTMASEKEVLMQVAGKATATAESDADDPPATGGVELF